MVNHDDVTICPECSSDNTYRYGKEAHSGGGYGPNLLPELGKNSLSMAKMTITVCADCGLIRLLRLPGCKTAPCRLRQMAQDLAG